MSPTDDNTPETPDADAALRTIAAAVIRLEGSVEKVSTRLEQIVGMIQLLDARMDRLGETFVRHEHPGEAA